VTNDESVHQITVQFDLTDLAQRIAAAISESEATSSLSPWLDVERAAEYLGCSSERIRKLIARHQIPFHQERAGGRIFLHRRELDDWLLSQ